MPTSVALFISCLTDQFYPRVGIAMTKVLERLGCEVNFPASQTCCGRALHDAGRPAEAATLARKFVAEFAEADYVVTPSPACCAMVRQSFAALIAADDPAAKPVRYVADGTYEFATFIETILRVDLSQLGAPPGRIIYQPACQLQRIDPPVDPTPALLAQMKGPELCPLDYADECCGFGGPFAAAFPAVSGAIVEGKVSAIRRSAAATVVCNEAGCTLHMDTACRQRGQTVRFRHLAEIIAEAMNLDCDRF